MNDHPPYVSSITAYKKMQVGCKINDKFVIEVKNHTVFLDNGEDRFPVFPDELESVIEKLQEASVFLFGEQPERNKR